MGTVGGARYNPTLVVGGNSMVEVECSEPERLCCEIVMRFMQIGGLVVAADSLRFPVCERPPVPEAMPAVPAGTEPDSLANVAAETLERTLAAVDGADTSIPEEGVYAPPRPRKVLFSEVVEFRTETLPRRKPQIPADDKPADRGQAIGPLRRKGSLDHLEG
jgi:hypothetical protein